MKKLWEQYIEEGAPITGYNNYMQDRLEIMMLHKQGFMRCTNKFKSITDPKKRALEIYKCEIPIINATIERLQSQSEKCQNTKFPEKCEEFYNQLIPNLQYRLKFNNGQIDTLNRKTGKINYD